MKALVTGATGLIGSHIARQWAERGHSVRVLVRPGRTFSCSDPQSVDIVEGDILDVGSLRAAVSECDVVFHAAAHFTYGGLSKETIESTAVAGTQNVLKACADAGVRKVVVTSSSVVFGFSNSPNQSIGESAVAAPVSDDPPYVLAKILQHRAALAEGERLGLHVVLACPTITIGRTSGALGPSNAIVVSYLMDPFHCTFAGGCNIVAVEDIARGHVLLAEKGRAGESYLLGGENLEWRQIHTIVSELAGVPGPFYELNAGSSYVAASMEEWRAWAHRKAPLTTREQASMVGRYYWYDHAKAAKIGYAPLPAREALTRTISWLAASKFVDRETRAGLKLSPEIYAFRRAHPAAMPVP